MTARKWGIRTEVHSMIGGVLNVSKNWCHATAADIAAGKIPVSIYPCEAKPGVTADAVRDLVSGKIGDFPNVKAVRVSSESFI